MGRLVGVDFGTRRVGVALSDPDGVIATPLEVIDVEGPAHAANAVARLGREREAAGIVVGMPRNMDGSFGPAARGVEEFVGLLRQRTPLPVFTWDERMTTKSALDALAEAGAGTRTRKRVVDKLAAQIMLQGYLDARPPRGEP
jgi:putative Holliday junction resolvase